MKINFFGTGRSKNIHYIEKKNHSFKNWLTLFKMSKSGCISRHWTLILSFMPNHHTVQEIFWKSTNSIQQSSESLVSQNLMVAKNVLNIFLFKHRTLLKLNFSFFTYSLLQKYQIANLTVYSTNKCAMDNRNCNFGTVTLQSVL